MKISIFFFNFYYLNFKTCHLKFDVWTDSSETVNLTSKGGKTEMDLTSYVDTNEWFLLNTSVTRNEIKYECCQQIYADLTYSVSFQHRPLFYIMFLITPLLFFLFLNLITFALLDRSFAKFLLCLIEFLVYVVGLYRFVDTMLPGDVGVVPPPLLVIYLALMIFLTSLFMILSAASLTDEANNRVNDI